MCYQHPQTLVSWTNWCLWFCSGDYFKSYILAASSPNLFLTINSLVYHNHGRHKKVSSTYSGAYCDFLHAVPGHIFLGIGWSLSWIRPLWVPPSSFGKPHEAIFGFLYKTVQTPNVSGPPSCPLELLLPFRLAEGCLQLLPSFRPCILV